MPTLPRLLGSSRGRPSGWEEEAGAVGWMDYTILEYMTGLQTHNKRV